MSKKSTFELVEDFIQVYKNKLEFRSGKWFFDKKEVRYINEFLLKTRAFNDINAVENFKDTYIAYTESHSAQNWRWFELPLIEEARQLKELKPLCYPLTQKQLTIINALIQKEEVFFILTGVGGSGKSTFANIVCQIFDNDTASLTLSELGDDFKLAQAIDKRLIYSTEINADEINNGRIKQLVSNEEILVNPKHQAPYKAHCQARFFFNCNIIPRLNLCDSGMIRRTIYYHMNEAIKNPDTSLAQKEWTHDDIVNIVAHALQIDMTNWKSIFEDETKELLLSNNSVYMNYDKDTYEGYSQACKSQGLKPFSMPNWQAIRKLIEEWQVLTPADIDIDIFGD